MSGSFQDYVRRTDMAEEIESLQDALITSVNRNKELQREIDELSKKVNRLENKREEPSSWEQKYQEILGRITRLEEKSDINENNHSDGENENKSDITTRQEETLTELSEGHAVTVMGDTGDTEKITDIILQSSEMKREILTEALLSISDTLSKHGIT